MKLLLITITIFLYITQAKKPHKFSFFRFLQVQNLFSQNEEPEIQSQKNSSSDSSNNSANILKEGWLRISSLSLYNTKKYPNIPLPKQNFAKVEVVRHNQDNANPNFYSSGSPYRKNSHYVGANNNTSIIPSQDSFWFRISGTYLYYTESQYDMIVLGAISVLSIQGTTQSSIGSNCFHINNLEKDQWDLCASNQSNRREWICAISQALNKPCQSFKEPLIIEEKRIIKQPILLIPLPSPYCNEDWNYMSHGSDWNCKCKEGFEQSPINVERRCVNNANMTASFSFFKVSGDKIKGSYEENIFVMRIKNEEDMFGSIIDMDYAEYVCREIRFHTPGEHTIEGRKFDMEIQMIYQPITEGDYKKKAGLAFLVNQKPGQTNEFFDAIDLLELPNIYKKEMNFSGKKEIDVEQLFQNHDDEFEYNGYFSYWRYEGSLTYPPCDEHVRWFIVEKPVSLGYAALEMMKSILQIPQMSSEGHYVADLRSPPNPDGNNRDLQAIRQRDIYYFDMTSSNCVPNPKRKIKSQGHYEKVTKKMDSYVYVEGLKPSGIEGALVVPKWEAFGVDSPEEERERDVKEIYGRTE